MGYREFSLGAIVLLISHFLTERACTRIIFHPCHTAGICRCPSVQYRSCESASPATRLTIPSSTCTWDNAVNVVVVVVVQQLLLLLLWTVDGDCRSADITGGPCREYSYVLHQFHLHWGETDSAGSEHFVNGLPTAAEVRIPPRLPACLPAAEAVAQQPPRQHFYRILPAATCPGVLSPPAPVVCCESTPTSRQYFCSF